MDVFLSGIYKEWETGVWGSLDSWGLSPALAPLPKLVCGGAGD